MSPIRTFTVCALVFACARSAPVQRPSPALDAAPATRAEASRAAPPRVVMDHLRVCVLAGDSVRCGSWLSGESESLWGEPMAQVSSIALGYRACLVREGRAACAAQDLKGFARPVLHALPFDAPVRDLVIDGVHGRVCARTDARVVCVDDRDVATPLFEGASRLYAGYATLWATDGARHLWCEGEGLCARLRAAGTVNIDDVDEDSRGRWVGRRDPRVAAGRVEGVGALDELTIDEGMLCARNDDGRVWCVGELFAPVEVRSMHGARGLVLVGARVCVREGDALRCVLPGDERAHTIGLDGALAIAVGGNGVCAVDGGGAVRCARVAGAAPLVWRPVALSP